MKTLSVVLLTVNLFFGIELVKGASITKDEEVQQNKVCGYESCTKSDSNKINIHIVPHSHDDVGWLKTFDQYYFGSLPFFPAGVQDIIESVVNALVKNPTRKFIQVETAYLWKWWLQQDEKKRQEVRDLINEGRLEIIGGAWSMNDEATTHYHSLVDHYTWGFRRLNDTFGECARPKIGWQIDPFGHSREQASMFAQFGFDGLLFARLDYQDKSKRQKDKTMEFIWEGSPNLGSSSNLFTSVLYNFYFSPNGFCFDITCDDEPMNDDPESPDYNVDRRVAEFLKFIDKQAENYRTNNVILTMGGDFQYQYAEVFYRSLDKLINGVNKLNGTQYKAFYSTPSCYLKAVNEQNLTWTTKDDDFFPYGSDPNAYWTGYYTSRPALKFFERMGNNFLQVVKQLTSQTNTADSKELELFREAMGVMQHHDAITGTEKQHVANDYARILHYSMKNGEKLASDALRKWASKGSSEKQVEFHSCLLLNISSCEHTSDNSKFVITVYNPTSQPLTTYVRVPVQGSEYSVLDFSGKEVVTQIVPVLEAILKLPGRVSKATKELVFQASQIAPLSYQSYYVSQKAEEETTGIPIEHRYNDIGTKNYNVSVNAKNRVFVKTPSGIQYEQFVQYYEGADGDNKATANRASGAYVFRPKGNYIVEPPVNGGYRIFKGPVVEEMHQVINDWITQVVRVYKDEEYVEFDWLVGPIPINDNIGKEVFMKYSSNLKNKGEFYTDSNGREMLKRKLNYRPTWKLDLKEGITGNYYPVTAKISIEDKEANSRVSVLNDRAQGGSSLSEGYLELMVHRRLLHDDSFGVSEPLNESAYGQGLVVRGKHILLADSLQNRDELFLREKEEAVKLALRPWLFITPDTESFDEWGQLFNMKGEGIVGELPRNIHILTLEPWKDGHILLRLEHLFERDESPKYSVNTQVDLKKLFATSRVESVVETTLGANQRTEENVRLTWRAEKNDASKEENDKVSASSDNTVINLKPMEIRTFLVKLSSSK